MLCELVTRSEDENAKTKVCRRIGPDHSALFRKATNLSLRRAGHSPGYVSCRNATPIDHNEFEGLLEIRSFGYRLEPRYIFRAGRLDQ